MQSPELDSVAVTALATKEWTQVLRAFTSGPVNDRHYRQVLLLAAPGALDGRLDGCPEFGLDRQPITLVETIVVVFTRP